MGTEIEATSDNGLAVIFLCGAFIYMACKMTTWKSFPTDDDEDEDKLGVFSYDLTNPCVDFMSTTAINEHFVDHTFPIPARIPTPPTVAVYNVFLTDDFSGLRRPDSGMMTFREMLESRTDLGDRLPVPADHQVGAIDPPVVEKQPPRPETPLSEISLESEVISRGSTDSWDVLSV